MRPGFGGLDLEFGCVGDFSADVVGKSAVGEGDFAAAFEDDDVGVFCDSACACCCAHASCDTADDDDAVGGGCLCVGGHRVSLGEWLCVSLFPNIPPGV